MKTLQFISTAIFLSLTSISLATVDDEKKTSKLTIEIIEINSPTCNGGENGSVTVLARGGKAPYNYIWNTFPNQTTARANNLSEGTYFVQVTDAKGDVFFESIKIHDPNTSILNKNVSNVEDLTITVNGLNAPYIFYLNDKCLKTKLNVSDLSIGIHQLKIVDVNQCEMTQYIQVFETEKQMKLLKESKEKIKANNERTIEASRLIPTRITKNDTRTFQNNLVLLSKN